jgi:hypothetical protein
MKFRLSTATLFLLGACLTAIIYWPGLNGGYLFDDFPNIVENRVVHITELSYNQFRDAALASPSRELKRPLAMLSFGVNHYLTGLAPFPMKLTNLVLHLLNGCLLFGLLRTLLILYGSRSQPLPGNIRPDTLAALVAMAWLLAPINLTPVLYVVQRMAGLAQVFVLAGLWMYLMGRERQLDGRPGRIWLLSGLLLGTVLGLGAKEEAILLPAFALSIELTVLRFATSTSQRSLPLLALLIVLAITPLLAGLAWLLPDLVSGNAYTARPFTLSERLLTESRVLVLYLSWTLLPLPGTLSFYHDDILVSSGLFNPWTTIAAILLLSALMLLASACRRQLPLLSLGLLWFFIAHSLTATVIPLELVFEHRNYFASAGLLLAAITATLSGLERSGIRLVGPVLITVLLVWFSAVTAMRSTEWSNPIRLANTEAMTHPDSPRANYELGRTLVILSKYDPKSPLLEDAKQAFRRAMSLPGSGILPEQGLIMIAGRTQTPTDPKWWQSIVTKLSSRPASAEDAGAIEKLLHCQLERRCPLEVQQMFRIYMAALGYQTVNTRLLVSYAQFAAFMLGDMELANQVALEALAQGGDLRDIREALKPVFDAVRSGPQPVYIDNTQQKIRQ